MKNTTKSQLNKSRIAFKNVDLESMRKSIQTKHALKLEDLEMTLKKADQIETAIMDFLSNLNFNEERIENLDCRSRDGFSPFSYNKGGKAATAWMDQMYAEQWISGFKNASATLEKYHDQDVESFCKDNNISEIDYEDSDLVEKFDNYRDNSESTVLFSCDVMLRSETELNVRICVCVKDAPYHRQYDDLFSYNIKFQNVTQLKAKLKSLLSKKDVSRFSRAVCEGF